jgi:hypothetical protein
VQQDPAPYWHSRKNLGGIEGRRDGNRMPIKFVASPGTDKVVRLCSDTIVRVTDYLFIFWMIDISSINTMTSPQEGRGCKGRYGHDRVVVVEPELSVTSVADVITLDSIKRETTLRHIAQVIIKLR